MLVLLLEKPHHSVTIRGQIPMMDAVSFFIFSGDSRASSSPFITFLLSLTSKGQGIIGLFHGGHFGLQPGKAQVANNINEGSVTLSVSIGHGPACTISLVLLITPVLFLQ